MAYLLMLLLVVPLLGAAVMPLLPGGRAARGAALLASLLNLGFALIIAAGFSYGPGAAGVQLSLGATPDNPLAIPAIGFRLALGLDTVSLWLVLLTAFLQPLAIAASFDAIRDRQKQYYAWMLVLLAAMQGVFLSRDLLLFYVFFELTLVPMFFIIGIWGGPERRRAAGRFFLFTFTGSIFTLAAILYLGLRAGAGGGPSFDLNDIIAYAQSTLPLEARWWVLLGLLAGFAVKVPLFPVHTWLPLAHTEAPTAGSVILAGVLLKLGTYGLLRLAVPIGLITAGAPLFPGLIRFIGVLCVVGIIYGALVAWVQRDIKKLVAYSSVSHLGFCVLGLAALNSIGIQGSVLYMINHGLSTGALFLVVGMVYDRYHTRDIDQLSGLGRQMPVMSAFFVFFALSSIGLPGLNGFVSEFLTVLGAFTSPHLGIGFGVFAALGVVLGAVYMLHMVARVVFGPLKTPHAVEPHGQEDQGHAASPQEPRPPLPRDLGPREIAVLAPIAVAVLLLGLVPTPVLRSLLGPAQALQRPIVQPVPVAIK